MVADLLSLSFSKVYFWRGAGSCEDRVAVCYVKVHDSCGTFRMVDEEAACASETNFQVQR